MILGSNISYRIAGVRRVRIKTYDGVVRVVGGVRYVRDLKRNLISLNTLDLKGYKYTGLCSYEGF